MHSSQPRHLQHCRPLGLIHSSSIGKGTIHVIALDITSSHIWNVRFQRARGEDLASYKGTRKQRLHSEANWWRFCGRLPRLLLIIRAFTSERETICSEMGKWSGLTAPSIFLDTNHNHGYPMVIFFQPAKLNQLIDDLGAFKSGGRNRYACSRFGR